MTESATRVEAERARLTGYIENSRRVQRRLRMALPIGIALAIAAWFFDGRIGFALMAVSCGVVGIGYWITWGHIADWNTRLEVMAPRSDAARGSRYAP